MIFSEKYVPLHRSVRSATGLPPICVASSKFYFINYIILCTVNFKNISRRNWKTSSRLVFTRTNASSKRPQQAAIQVAGKEVLNFCANNYLGLSNNPRLIQAAKDMMDRRGYGMSSVRFICGTQDVHKELEAAISDYFKTEDTILYAACFSTLTAVCLNRS